MTKYEELSEAALKLMADFSELDIAEIAADALATQSRTAGERDAAYRERARLVAWLACLYPSVIAPAPDLEEPGWQIVYLTTPAGQASWHIHPRDAEFFTRVEHVAADDPRAQWDGHTTEAKYERIASLTRLLADTAAASGALPCACTVVTRCAVCRAEDAVIAERTGP